MCAIIDSDNYMWCRFMDSQMNDGEKLSNFHFVYPEIQYGGHQTESTLISAPRCDRIKITTAEYTVLGSSLQQTNI